jgi:hypothetical protein
MFLFIIFFKFDILKEEEFLINFHLRSREPKHLSSSMLMNKCVRMNEYIKETENDSDQKTKTCELFYGLSFLDLLKNIYLCERKFCDMKRVLLNKFLLLIRF